MNRKLWVILVILALGLLLLPAGVLAQEVCDAPAPCPPVSVEVTPPSPVRPDIIGPIVFVEGVADTLYLLNTGPEIQFSRNGTPTITHPDPIGWYPNP